LGIFAFVAVSQAAFTANLVQQAQPALAKAMFKIRLAAKSTNVNSAFHDELATAIQNQANDLLSQISNLVDAGYQVAQTFHSHLAGTLAELQSLSPERVVVTAGAVITAAVSGAVGAAVSTVLGWLFGKSDRFLGTIIDFISNTSLTDILNAIATQATNAVNSLDLTNLLANGIGAIIPEPIATLITNQLGLTRGFFGDLWTSISNGASSAWEHITGIASSMWDAATVSFAQVQQMASAFASNAWSEATAITSEAAQQFLDFLKPYQQDLGNLYDQVSAQVSQILGN